MSVAGSKAVNWNRRERKSPGLAARVSMGGLSDEDFFCFLLALVQCL